MNDRDKSVLFKLGYKPVGIEIYCRDEILIISYSLFIRFDLLVNIHRNLSNYGKDIIEIDDCSLFDAIMYIEKNGDKLEIPEQYEIALDYLGYQYVQEYPLGYDPEYVKIYEEEKTYRNLNGFDNLNINKYRENCKPTAIYCDKNEYSEKQKYISRYYNALKIIFNDYKDDIVIAGGFALSCLKECDFNDIDIFFICSEERAKEIIKYTINHRLAEKVYDSKNSVGVIFNFFSGSSERISFSPNFVKIQFIKRIYRSPSEIIHGFDIDCTCILKILDGYYYDNLWMTKRCSYAIRNSCNTINFEKLSPSYEYRLHKYYKRGFGIVIPNYLLFMRGISQNTNLISKNGGGNLSKMILFDKYNKVSDYSDLLENPKDESDFEELLKNIKFKNLNPAEQAINTFNRIILEDIILWYPNNTKNEIFTPPVFIDTIIELPKEIIKQEPFNNLNLISRSNIKDKKIFYPKSYMYEFVDQNVNIALIGPHARHIITGDKNLPIYVNLVRLDNEPISEIMDRFVKFYINNACYKEILKIYLTNGYYNKIKYTFEEADKIINIVKEKLKKLYTLITEESSKEVEIISGKKYSLENFEEMNLTKYLDIRLSMYTDNISSNIDIFLGNTINISLDNLLPKIRFYTKVCELENAILLEPLDYDKIIYNNGKIFTNDTGLYAIENKLHFSSYTNSISSDLLFKPLQYKFFINENNRKLLAEKDGYCSYDTKNIRKLKRLIDN